MAKCKRGKTVGCHISFEIANVIDMRAKKMGWSISRYIGYILEDWYARGCPAINNIEEALGVSNIVETRATALVNELKSDSCASNSKGNSKQ